MLFFYHLIHSIPFLSLVFKGLQIELLSTCLLHVSDKKTSCQMIAHYQFLQGTSLWPSAVI